MSLRTVQNSRLADGAKIDNLPADTVSALSGKQATLISGTNIKTINGTTLLGGGDLVIAGAGTVTNVSSANADISVANPTTTPVLTLNSSEATTASTIVKRDASKNIYVNNFFGALETTVSAGGTTVLTVASARSQTLTGATTQTFQLPDATTLPLTAIFDFNNNSSSSLIVKNAGGTTLYTVPAGGVVNSAVIVNTTANGSWDFSAQAPASVTWGSGIVGLVMNSVLTTSPSVASGASSSTVPAFIPQRGANTTGFGGDGTNLYATIAGIGRLIVTSTGIGIRNVANTFTGSLTNTITANRTYTLPDKTGTLATTEEPNFWKYSLSRTVASGNMTTTLLNYLGATPSASAPVNVQVGNVVYSITSARSIVLNAGTNWMNLGSTELATKEVDLFSYLGYSTGTGGIVLLAGRNPNELTGAGNSFSAGDERFMQTVGGAGTVSPVVNIGRFNAILSAGAGYTWSIPTTSTIINSPIFSGNLVPNALPRVNKVTSITTSVTMDAFSYDLYDITAQAGALLFNKPSISSPYNGQKLMVRIKDNGTSRSLTYGTGISAGAGTLPSTTTISKKTWIGLQYDVTDDVWYCLASGTEA